MIMDYRKEKVNLRVERVGMLEDGGPGIYVVERQGSSQTERFRDAGSREVEVWTLARDLGQSGDRIYT